MNKAVKHDDSNLIWFDYNDLDFDALNNTIVSHFDIFNMPVEYSHTDLIGNACYIPKEFELDGYMVCFFKDHLSETGYSCMCINKDRGIYKSGEGYINGKPSKELY